MVKDKIKRKKESKQVEETLGKHEEDVVEDEASKPVEADSQKKKKNAKKGQNTSAGDAEGSPTEGEGKGKKMKAPPLRETADDPLVKEVVEVILAGIADPESQKDGKAFVPKDWSTKYKTKLGPYKKFLMAHPAKFALVEDGTGKFIIKKPEDVGPDDQTQARAPLIKGSTWQKKLTDAWMAYCLSVPREKRDFELFLAPMPRTARLTKLSAEAPAVAATPGGDSEKASKKRKQGSENKVAASEEVAAPEVSRKKMKKKKVVSSSPDADV